MGGFIPLLIDIWVASLGGAGFRRKEEIGWDQLTGICFDGRGKEVSGCTTAFFVHARGGECWVLDEIRFIRQVVLCEFRANREKNNNR